MNMWLADWLLTDGPSCTLALEEGAPSLILTSAGGGEREREEERACSLDFGKTELSKDAASCFCHCPVSFLEHEHDMLAGLC